jgi:hypothetical protein
MSHTDDSPVLPAFQQMLKIRRPLPANCKLFKCLSLVSSLLHFFSV